MTQRELEEIRSEIWKAADKSYEADLSAFEKGYLLGRCHGLRCALEKTDNYELSLIRF